MAASQLFDTLGFVLIEINTLQSLRRRPKLHISCCRWPDILRVWTRASWNIGPYKFLIWAVAKTWVLFLYTNIRLPRTLPRYFRGHSFHFRGRSRTTIHFRSTSAYPIFRKRGASALRVFTSAGSSYFKPKIKRIHGVLVAAHFSHILLVIVWVCPRCKYTLYIYYHNIYIYIYVHIHVIHILYTAYSRYIYSTHFRVTDRFPSTHRPQIGSGASSHHPMAPQNCGSRPRRWKTTARRVKQLEKRPVQSEGMDRSDRWNGKSWKIHSPKSVFMATLGGMWATQCHKPKKQTCHLGMVWIPWGRLGDGSWHWVYHVYHILGVFSELTPKPFQDEVFRVVHLQSAIEGML